MDLDETFEELLTSLPVEKYAAGEAVLAAGSKSGRLLILKQGEVVVLKDSVEIARVAAPGAVFGEISALLNLPHSADIRTLKESHFYTADAALADKDPTVLRHIARILARRILEANKNLVELKSQAGASGSVMSRMLGKIERVLSVGGASFET